MDKLAALCADAHISPYKMCEQIGLNRSAVAKWKKGSIPTGTTLNKIADHFGVSVDYLLGNSVTFIFGNAIKKERTKLGLSSNDLASRIGISENKLKKYEKNQIGIPDYIFEKMAKQFSMTTKEFIQKYDNTDNSPEFDKIVKKYEDEYESIDNEANQNITDLEFDEPNIPSDSLDLYLLLAIRKLTHENKEKLLELARLYAEHQDK